MHDFLFSLRTKALLLAGMAFAVFVGIMWIHAAAERKARLEFVRDQLQNTAKLIAAQQNRIIEYPQQFLESLIVRQSGRRTLLPEDCERTLAQRLQEEPRLANIIVALPDGSVVCSATPSAQASQSCGPAQFPAGACILDRGHRGSDDQPDHRHAQPPVS